MRSAGGLWNTMWCSFDRVYRKSAWKKNVRGSVNRRYGILSLYGFQFSWNVVRIYHVDSWTTSDLNFCLVDIMAVAFIFIRIQLFLQQCPPIQNYLNCSRFYLEIDNVYK